MKRRKLEATVAHKAFCGKQRSSAKSTRRNKDTSGAIEESLSANDGFLIPNSDLGKAMGLPQMKAVGHLIECGIIETEMIAGRETLEIADKFKDLGLARMQPYLVEVPEFRDGAQLYWSERSITAIRRLIAVMKTWDLQSISGLVLRGILSEADRTTVVAKTGRALV
jgi:hypothetical protein